MVRRRPPRISIAPVRRIAPLLALAAVLAPLSGRAETSASSASKAEASGRQLRLALSVEPSEEPFTWVIRLENAEDVPLRVLADPNLLSFDVTAPPVGQRDPVTQHCVLPSDMRPDGDEGGTIQLPAHAAYVETVDPRLYCFDAAKARALVAGASVVAHFGFKPRRPAQAPRTGREPAEVAPFVAWAPAAHPELVSAKEVVSGPITLGARAELAGEAASPAASETETPPDAAPATPSAPHPDTAPRAPAAPHSEAAARVGGPDLPAPTIKVSSPARIDAEHIRDIMIPITVTNTGAKTTHLLLRPETVVLVADDGAQTTNCQLVITPTPIAELFTTLPPKGRATTDVPVTPLCPESFFSRPGLYTLRAVVDTRLASGERIGLKTFTGRVAAEATTLVRVHSVAKRRMP